MGQPISAINFVGLACMVSRGQPCVGDPDPGPEVCPTCCQPLDAPYRAWDTKTEVLIHGCIDQCHGEHLKTGSRDFKWHFRHKAEVLRARLRAGI